MIRPYLRDIINDYNRLNNAVINYKTRGEQKTQLSMKISFISLKTSD